jgi:hypothetical protein
MESTGDRILLKVKTVDLAKIAARVAAGKPSWVKWFHVSPWDLGTTAVLKPRVPSVPDRSGEDMTTPRVCLAPTVESAITARVTEDDMPYRSDETEGMYVYGIGAISVYVPNSEGVPEQEGNPYGMGWDWDEYADFKGFSPDDQAAYEETVKNCVPDAASTGEVWSLGPVRMTKVGRFRGEKVVWNVPKGAEDDHE